MAAQTYNEIVASKRKQWEKSNESSIDWQQLKSEVEDECQIVFGAGAASEPNNIQRFIIEAMSLVNFINQEYLKLSLNEHPSNKAKALRIHKNKFLADVVKAEAEGITFLIKECLFSNSLTFKGYDESFLSYFMEKFEALRNQAADIDSLVNTNIRELFSDKLYEEVSKALSEHEKDNVNAPDQKGDQKRKAVQAVAPKEDSIERTHHEDERKLDGFTIPSWIGLKEIPTGLKIISTPAIHRIQGFANVVRGLEATDSSHDYRKSIKHIAEKYLEEKKQYLIWCDKRKSCFWTGEENRTLFKPHTQGRRRRSPELRR